MKKLLLFIVLLPTFLLAQPGPPPPCPWVNDNFPEVTHFDGQNSPLIVPVIGSQPWSFQNGSTYLVMGRRINKKKLKKNIKKIIEELN